MIKVKTKMYIILLQLVSLNKELIKQAHEGVEERVNGVNNKEGGKVKCILSTG